MTRLILASLVWLLWAVPAQAAITVVQTQCNTGSGVSSITVTFGGATTAGNFVVALSATYSSGRDVTFADGNGGETWSEPTNGDVTYGSPIFGRTHINAMTVSTGSTTIVATYSGSLGGNGTVCAYEFTGGAATLFSLGARDGLQSSTTSFSTASGGTSSGTITTTATNSVLVGMTWGGGGATLSCDAAYTSVRATTDEAFCYRIVSSTGTYGITNTGSVSANGATHLAAIDGTGGGGGGGGGAPKNCLLLGVCE